MTSTEEKCDKTEVETKKDPSEPSDHDSSSKMECDAEKIEEGDDNQEKPLSKKQQNRLKWKQRYLEKRLVKRVEERERKKAKRAAMREAGEFEKLKRKRGKKMADSNSKQRVIIDMSFDDLMSEKDQKRTVQQINWCYAANRHCPEPFQFHVVGFDGPSRKMYDGIEANWNQDIHLHTEKLEQVFPKEDIVYLTAESENLLTELDDTKAYVIGGIVDHNSQKGLCHRIAEEKGYGHARLPIDEYVHLKTRRVLTINQVYEILVHFSVHKDWEQAFLSIVPERKGLKKKEKTPDDPEATTD
ncbi:unnamed protein product [Caenorhabditis bovis]|uniref:tRNA (guanine(9)-N(1))-methyltransferase n=1 Tax=Caenorhabditis bovis TaxID=2654633 RepID=A0A8S1F2S6_9PELO|nr:unnamed protein product [Caenorhabditis bovis]